jgi:hypothetical protein
MSAGASADAAESPSKQRRLITAVPPLGFFDPLREAYRREQLATSAPAADQRLTPRFIASPAFN